MFEFISKMISPSKGIEMLKKGIENILQRPVDHFELIFVAAKDDLLFKVEGKIYPYVGTNKGMIAFTVKQLARTKLKENEQLDIVRCEYNPDASLNLEICLTVNGEKIKHSINNYKP